MDNSSRRKWKNFLFSLIFLIFSHQDIKKLKLKSSSCSYLEVEVSKIFQANTGLTFDLWTLAWASHPCWQSHYTAGGATDTKSIIHRAGAWSQLISVQSGCNRLKHIRCLPGKHFPKENGSTLAVSHSLTLLLQEHSYKPETDQSDRPIYHVHLFCLCKNPPLGID